MRETSYWRRYLRFLGSDPAGDVDDELEFHFAMRVEDLMRGGLPEADARRKAEREFGIRMALGSSRGSVAALVLRQGAVWMAAGLAGGLLGMVLVVRVLRDLLFGVAPYDPLALGLAVALLAACAAVALFVPVRRATRVDPAVALRA